MDRFFTASDVRVEQHKVDVPECSRGNAGGDAKRKPSRSMSAFDAHLRQAISQCIAG
jgi:hypothetical protein